VPGQSWAEATGWRAAWAKVTIGPHRSAVVELAKLGDEEDTGAGLPLLPGTDQGRVEAAHRGSRRRRGGGGDGGLVRPDLSGRRRDRISEYQSWK
jgi:hypothetical protein